MVSLFDLLTKECILEDNKVTFNGDTLNVGDTVKVLDEDFKLYKIDKYAELRPDSYKEVNGFGLLFSKENLAKLLRESVEVYNSVKNANAIYLNEREAFVEFKNLQQLLYFANVATKPFTLLPVGFFSSAKRDVFDCTYDEWLNKEEPKKILLLIYEAMKDNINVEEILNVLESRGYRNLSEDEVESTIKFFGRYDWRSYEDLEKLLIGEKGKETKSGEVKVNKRDEKERRESFVCKKEKEKVYKPILEIIGPEVKGIDLYTKVSYTGDLKKHEIEGSIEDFIEERVLNKIKEYLVEVVNVGNTYNSFASLFVSIISKYEKSKQREIASLFIENLKGVKVIIGGTKFNFLGKEYTIKITDEDKLNEDYKILMVLSNLVSNYEWVVTKARR